MIVVADTGPIHYLVLSGLIGLLHQLYGDVVLPQCGQKGTQPPIGTVGSPTVDCGTPFLGFNTNTRCRNRL